MRIRSVLWLLAIGIGALAAWQWQSIESAQQPAPLQDQHSIGVGSPSGAEDRVATGAGDRTEDLMAPGEPSPLVVGRVLIRVSPEARGVPLPAGQVIFQAGAETRSAAVVDGDWSPPAGDDLADWRVLAVRAQGEDLVVLPVGLEAALSQPLVAYAYEGFFVEVVDPGGEPLSEVVVRRSPGGRSAPTGIAPVHPGHPDLTSVVVEGEPSPVYVPCRIGKDLQHWVGSEGWTWAPVRAAEASAETLQRRVLEPAASLSVWIPKFQQAQGLRMVLARREQVVATIKSLSRGDHLITGLPAGEIEAFLSFEPGFTAGGAVSRSGELRLVPGETSKAVLEMPDLTGGDDLSDLSGSLVIEMPEFWSEDLEFQRLGVRIQADGAPDPAFKALPESSRWIRLEAMQPVDSALGSSSWSWHVAGFPSGTYAAVLEPFGMSVSVQVGAGGTAEVLHHVPPLAKTVFEVTDGENRLDGVKLRSTYIGDDNDGRALSVKQRAVEGAEGLEPVLLSLPGTYRVTAVPADYPPIVQELDFESGWNQFRIPVSRSPSAQVRVLDFRGNEVELGAAWHSVEVRAMGHGGELVGQKLRSRQDFRSGKRTTVAVYYFSEAGEYVLDFGDAPNGLTIGPVTLNASLTASGTDETIKTVIATSPPEGPATEER